jgi:glycosyltransferase involved in cell wall biosynthesis
VSRDVIVLGQDPRFGGGGRALGKAFLDGVRDLGHVPELHYRPHPGLGERRAWPQRIEALHQLRAAHELAEAARRACVLWVVATSAPNGAAARRSSRPYDCWLATTVDAEWHGRASGMSLPHRRAAALSLPVLRRLEQSVLRHARRIYATSAAARDDLAAISSSSRVEVLPVPVDTVAFVPETDAPWLERLGAAPVVGFVGRADDPRKNIPLLLDAFAHIRARIPTARLRLMGRPPLGALAEGVTATGVIADIAAPLRECALFVLPSRQEGFGIAAAEALASGVPVVSTPSGGPEELVRESGGGVVLSSFDSEELSDAVIALLQQPERLTAARRAGRTYVEAHHSPAAFRKRLAAIMAVP